MISSLLKLALILSSTTIRVKTVQLYISPHQVDNETCLVDHIALSPCYSLSQYNQTSLLGQASVTVLFLPGRHMIIKSHDFVAMSISELQLRPWSEQTRAEIECQKSQLTFQDVTTVNISFIDFAYCAIEYAEDHLASFGEDNINTLNVYDCKFHGYYIIPITIIHVSLHIRHSTFNSTPGAISGRARVFTPVFGNRVYLSVDDCVFVNCTRGTTSGGALNIEYMQFSQ